MAFGSLCPGKRYALLQLKWFLVSVLNRFELRYAAADVAAADVAGRQSNLPQCDARYHGHEVLPPVCDVDVQFRHQTNCRRLHIAQDDLL